MNRIRDIAFQLRHPDTAGAGILSKICWKDCYQEGKGSCNFGGHFISFIMPVIRKKKKRYSAKCANKKIPQIGVIKMTDGWRKITAGIENEKANQ